MGGLIIVASLVAKLLEGLEPRCPMLADKPVNSVCLSICLSVSLSPARRLWVRPFNHAFYAMLYYASAV